MKKQIKESVTHVLESMGIADVIPQIDYPADISHGDYASNIAMVLAKRLKKNPMEIAEEIAKKLSDQTDDFEIEVARPGFINFKLTNEFLVKDLGQISIPQIGKGKKVVVEYSSPNIAKPFTIGHLRSTIIGDAVANLLQAVGYTVFRDNHIGDWGTQFGKQIAALKYIDLETGKVSEDLNDESVLKNNIKIIESSKRPVKELVELYVTFHKVAEEKPAFDDIARAEFAELENEDISYESNPDSRRYLWKKCIEWSWKEFDEIYKQLGIHFTENEGRGYGEAYFENKMESVIRELKEKKFLLDGKEGARIVELQDLPPLMILKKDGSTLYSTRDLATDKFRLQEYGKEVVIVNEVGAEQTLYFKQLYKLEEMLGWFKPNQRVHIKHGLYRFKEGKMSTRKGNVIWLEDVLAEAVKQATILTAVSGDQRGGFVGDIGERIQKDKNFSQGKRNADIHDIAIGAIKWNDLKRSPEQDIAFDWNELLNMQGNSGPYLQYSYVRTQSVIARSEETKQSHTQDMGLPHASLEAFAMTKEERDVLRLLTKFPEVVESAAVNYAPNTLCTYLFDLAQAFNLFYQKHQILKADDRAKAFRLALTKATGNVLKQGLDLLGIKAPEKM